MMKRGWLHFFIWYSLFYCWVNLLWGTGVTWLYLQYSWWWNIRNYLLWCIPAIIAYECFLRYFHIYKLRAILYCILCWYGGHWLIKTCIYGINFNWHSYFLKTAHLFFSTGLFGITYYFIRLAFHQEAIRREREATIKKAELSLLQSQFSPHFLFNCLNNIYALVYDHSEKALPAWKSLLVLWNFVHTEKNHALPVAVELDYIEQYINLQQLRHTDTLQIQWEKRNIQAKLYPLLLIPFIENAFKHGDLHTYPLEINISANKNTLSLFCRNALQKSLKDTTGGIGLANVQRRLQLLYPGRHTLTIDHSTQHFTVNLSIQYA